MKTKKQNRRYYLHRKLRKTRELAMNVRERQVLVPAGEPETATENKYAMCLLQEFGYNLQLTIK